MLLEKYIDIGIDFGAENIIVVAIGYDNKGRSDYKLISLDATTSIKNYIGQKKVDQKIEIGNNVKTAYAYSSSDEEYLWTGGRYKSFIGSNNTLNTQKNPTELLQLGLKQILEKVEKFDFEPILSGKLRNIVVGIPQNWDNEKKAIYRETLAFWKHGEVSLLSEPVAATISAYKKSLENIANNIIMILDIGASTFDISFAEYHEENKNLKLYDTSYRSNYSGYYFDLIFLAFTLLSETNKLASMEIIDRVIKLKLKTIDDYIQYFQKNTEKFSSLLLEIENIKENSINEIIKFNRKKLIDIGKKMPITINKQIFIDALNYYSEKLANEIDQVILKFKKNEVLEKNKEIYPFLCGGASSLIGLDKKLKEKIKTSEKDKLFNIIKDGDASKIDTTIALGLAYYAQDKSLIMKKLNYSIEIGFIEDTNNERINFTIFEQEEAFPITKAKKFSELLGSEKELEYFSDTNNNIQFVVIQKKDEKELKSYIVEFNADNISNHDAFDILFQLSIDEIINIDLINITKNYSLKNTLDVKL